MYTVTSTVRVLPAIIGVDYTCGPRHAHVSRRVGVQGCAPRAEHEALAGVASGGELVTPADE
ncbi:hypothetical protein FOMPIDRAFT_1026401 [Fomitopsis schrenkii]|uniref:Uncharacterized protein n=1 Tax=Fomitopsis schrenkii TaxID=2126942 RepID=S8EW36_FOMSC|nr:hypothetical protein FOMPIDRAFT_1026401 [Fomitopsis schrenkii]